MTIFVILIGGVVYLFISADKDREGRILFVTVLNDFRGMAPAIEKEITLTGKITPIQQSVNTDYLNSMDALTDLSYVIDIGNEEVTFTFSSTVKLLAGNTIIVEPVASQNGIKWLCNKGTVDKRYRPINCRNNTGIAISHEKAL